MLKSYQAINFSFKTFSEFSQQWFSQIRRIQRDNLDKKNEYNTAEFSAVYNFPSLSRAETTVHQILNEIKLASV